MRKIILFFVMALLSIGCHAQSPSVAYDHVTGTMMFDGGKDYAVVQMEGTQKELHDLIMTNLTRICNNASDNVTSFKSWADWYVYKSESKQQKHGYAIDQLNANMTALVNAIVSKSDGDW